MNRRKIVAGNWKMNGSRQEASALTDAIKQGVAQYGNVDVILLPSFVHLHQAQNSLIDTPIALGAQNLHPSIHGAFTGEISGPMLADYGCQFVLIGHSERRHLFNENLELIAAKFNAAFDFGLTPILCIGETQAQREAGATEEIIQQQLDSIIQSCDIRHLSRTIYAYEPVWAIGTGLTATPEQAQEVHAFIRDHLAKQSVEISNTARILYGGSVKAENALGLFSQIDIDGALVGGASLDAKSFLGICDAAEAVHDKILNLNPAAQL